MLHRKPPEAIPAVFSCPKKTSSSAPMLTPQSMTFFVRSLDLPRDDPDRYLSIAGATD
jgi:hypothetical protein